MSGTWISTSRDPATKSIQNSLFVRRVIPSIQKFQESQLLLNSLWEKNRKSFLLIGRNPSLPRSRSVPPVKQREGNYRNPPGVFVSACEEVGDEEAEERKKATSSLFLPSPRTCFLHRLAY